MEPAFYHTYVPDPDAERSVFAPAWSQPWPWRHWLETHPEAARPEGPAAGYRPAVLPAFEDARHLLPEPVHAGRATALAAYWRTWELLFDRSLRRATRENRFPSHFVGTAFNDATFLWDSACITLFARYGRRAWPAIHTLDNFYAKQHPDGFICREIRERDGEDKFTRFDPSGTGPNVLAWAEWEWFAHTGDLERLDRVFPPLAAYHAWCRRNRTWPDGSYWATGWSSGMDNQPRLPPAHHVWYEHGHHTWIDACAQAVLSARSLARMARALGRDGTAPDREADTLAAWVNTHLWDDSTQFYHDRRPDRSLATHVRTAGAYWMLLAGAVPQSRLASFCGHLDDPEHFGRTHRVPALSADTPGYDPDGGYWCGGVWPPLTYAIVCGLRNSGLRDLAHTIACNHVDHVGRAFEATGTLWETYSPDAPGQGRGKPDFVGWSGLAPVALTIEEMLGVQVVSPGKVHWRLHHTEEHGILRLPIGVDGTIDLLCARRASADERPKITVRASQPVEVEVLWPGAPGVLAIRSTG